MSLQLFHVSELLDHNIDGYIAVDTNILIELLDINHRNHKRALSFFEKARNRKIRFVYFIAAKIELQEYLRKRFFTNRIIGQIERDDIQIGNSKEFISWFKSQYSNLPNEDRILSDRELKELRTRLVASFPNFSKGIKEWQNFCRFSLGKFDFQSKLKHFHIEYKNLFDDELFPEGSVRPHWKDQEKLICNFGLGSSDATILNMAFACEKISALLTNDRDMTLIFNSQFEREIDCFTFVRGLLEAA